MTPVQNETAASDSIGIWLKRVALVAVIALLACSSWFVWRISMIAYQMETAIVAISADVKQISGAGAQISAHLEKLDDRLQSLEQKAADAMNLDEFEDLIDEIDTIRDSKPSTAGGPSPDAEREIKFLLRQIRDSKHRFVYSDEDKGSLRFYLQLYAKYKAYDNSITAAEDFIEKVGTKTIGGHPYNVVISPDETMALNEWLKQKLNSYRSVQTANSR